MSPGVASEAARMAPFQDLGSNRSRNIQSIRQSSSRVGFSSLGSSDDGLQTPSYHPDNLDWRENGFGDFGVVRSLGEKTGQGVGTGVFRAGTEGEGKVKTTEEQGPTSLPGIQSFSGSDIDQILVIGPNHKRLWSSLEPMSPFLESVMHIAIPYCQRRSYVQRG